jgi:two-component system OmpR family response regulator
MEIKQQPRIFIVEDNLLYQQLIAKELESLSGEIYFYTKGESCLEDLDKNPSIIVLDFELEGEINGLDTMIEIRKYNPSIYIILFSNKKDLNSYANVANYGSFDFLEKREKSFRLLKQMINTTYPL